MNYFFKLSISNNKGLKLKRIRKRYDLLTFSISKLKQFCLRSTFSIVHKVFKVSKQNLTYAQSVFRVVRSAPARNLVDEMFKVLMFIFAEKFIPNNLLMKIQIIIKMSDNLILYPLKFYFLYRIIFQN